MAAPQKDPHKERYLSVETTGRLRTSVDPTQLGKGDFQQLINMRYTDAPGIRAIGGTTKLNTVSLQTHYKTRAAFQFNKDLQPESHFIIQAFTTLVSQGISALLDFYPTVVPNQTTNPTLLAYCTSGAGIGEFTSCPNNCMAFGNGLDMLIWEGINARCSYFIVASSNGIGTPPTTQLDYTSDVNDAVSNTQYAQITQQYIHIASLRQLQGFYLQIPTGQQNTVSCTMTVSYWNGTGYTAVSGFTDNTSAAGVTLAQTGTVTFTSTVGSAQVRYFNNTVAYWYLVSFNVQPTASSGNVQVSYCTLNAPIQQVKDLWDGNPRDIDYLFIWQASGGFWDFTVNANQKDYVPGVGSTYVDMSNFANSRYFVVGFSQRMMGIYFDLVPGQYNNLPASVAVSYWNGSGWSAVSGLQDGTNFVGPGPSYYNYSLWQSGMISWTPPASNLEFTSQNVTSDLLYYYKIQWTNTATGSALSGNGAYIDDLTGIPAQKSLDTYLFPMQFQNRLCLCNDTENAPNQILTSAANTNCVFNGTDSVVFTFGDNRGIIAAISFFSRFSNNFYENLLVLKADSAWVVDGTGPSNYQIYRVAQMYGCEAPQTLVACDIGYAQGGTGPQATRNVVIWQSASHIVLWDTQTISPIDFDIQDVFDQRNSYAINPAMASQSQSFYDQVNIEYHWLWASGSSTVLNMESVFDLIRKKWYTINRGTNMNLQCGCNAMDSNNNKYTYGMVDTGYVEQLENGTTFDGNNMTFTHWSGDIPLAGWMEETQIRTMKPIMKSKGNTTNQLTVGHYGDGSNSAISTHNYNVNSTTNRIVGGAKNPTNTQSILDGNFIFHSFKHVMTTNNELIGYEPIGTGIWWKLVREDL